MLASKRSSKADSGWGASCKVSPVRLLINLPSSPAVRDVILVSDRTVAATSTQSLNRGAAAARATANGHDICGKSSVTVRKHRMHASLISTCDPPTMTVAAHSVPSAGERAHTPQRSVESRFGSPGLAAPPRLRAVELPMLGACSPLTGRRHHQRCRRGAPALRGQRWARPKCPRLDSLVPRCELSWLVGLFWLAQTSVAPSESHLSAGAAVSVAAFHGQMPQPAAGRQDSASTRLSCLAAAARAPGYVRAQVSPRAWAWGAPPHHHRMRIPTHPLAHVRRGTTAVTWALRLVHKRSGHGPMTYIHWFNHANLILV